MTLFSPAALFSSLALCALLPQAAAQEPGPRTDAPQSDSPRTDAPARDEASAPPADDARAAQEWWRDLSAEEREALRQRFQRFREMPEDARVELRQRLEVWKRERDLAWQRLGDDRRARLRDLPPHERDALLDREARDRMRDRSERLEGRFGGHDRLRGAPFEERRRMSRELLEQHRRDEVIAGLDRAAREGWIGPAAAQWARNAPLHEAMAVLGEVRKWRFLHHAEQRGLWDQWGVSVEERMRLNGLPAPHFFRELRGVAPPRGPEGVRRPHGGRGPHGDREPGARPPGPPPPPGEGPPRRDGRRR